MDLFQIAERLEHEPVDSAGEQAVHLAPEMVARFVAGGRSERLEPEPQRTDRPGDAGAVVGGGSGRLRRRLVDAFGQIGQPVRPELGRCGAERVGLENLGAGPDVLLVHFPHQRRLLQRQLVVADVEEEALGVQHRPHRAVEQMHAAVGNEVTQRRQGSSPGVRKQNARRGIQSRHGQAF